MNSDYLLSKPRVLFIAEEANPEWVSVPLVGWSLVKAMMPEVDGHLVTQLRNKDAIERTGWRDGKEFTAIDTEKLERPMWKLASALGTGKGKAWTVNTALRMLSYPYFERRVWQQFGPSITRGEYDLVHRVTPVSPAIKSSLATKCKAAGVPFVMGPLNGGVPWPKGFDRERRQEGEYLSYLRGALKVLPARKKSLKNAAAILIGSKYTEKDVPKSCHAKCIYLPENAIDPARFSLVSAQSIDGPLRACFIGRMVPCKGTDMLIEAAAPLLKQGKLVVDLIGDGPMMGELKRLAKDLGLDEALTFHGWKDHKDVQAIAAQSNLLIFPSIREFGGGVVLEAMALGVVPVICDYAGPGELVVEGTGYKIKMGTRPEIVSRLTAQLDEIYKNRDQLPQVAANARSHVKDMFTWSAKAKQVCQVYDWVLNNKKGRRPEPIRRV